jgi:hypothetical protein
MPLYKTDPYKILFLDIETVSSVAEFADLSESWQELWEGKTRYQRGEDESAASYYPKRAAVMAEFGKVVCISCGFLNKADEQRVFRVKSFYGNDEKKLLTNFAAMLKNHFDKGYVLCAHNGKEFDFPYLSRRMLALGIGLPDCLNTSGLKPWEVPHIDTMEMWKFGDWKNYTSLKLLAALFDIPTPKDDIDGSMVGQVYWEEGDLERIVTYCQKDTVTVASVFLKMEGLPTIEEKEIVISNE